MKLKTKIADFIGALLFWNGVFYFISSLVYSFCYNGNDYWAKRLFASMICLGFSAVIFKLDNKEKTTEAEI